MKFKSFAKTAKDAVTNLEKNFERDATDASQNPDSATSHENQAGEQASRSFTAEARKQADEKTAELMEKAAKARKAYAAAVAKTSGKPWPFWKKALFVVVTVTGFSAAVNLLPNTDRDLAEKKMREEVARDRDLQQQIAYTSNILLPSDQFNIMYGGLAVPSAPTPAPDTPVPLAAAALPPPVAAIAAAPAEVELTSDQGVKREVQTTVGQVYLQSPRPIQRQIEQSAPVIQHDYNEHSKPTPHYLDQHTNEWNRKIKAENERRWQESHHVNIDVTNGDGSARIRVKM